VGSHRSGGLVVEWRSGGSRRGSTTCRLGTDNTFEHLPRVTLRRLERLNIDAAIEALAPEGKLEP